MSRGAFLFVCHWAFKEGLSSDPPWRLMRRTAHADLDIQDAKRFHPTASQRVHGHIRTSAASRSSGKFMLAHAVGLASTVSSSWPPVGTKKNVVRYLIYETSRNPYQK